MPDLFESRYREYEEDSLSTSKESGLSRSVVVVLGGQPGSRKTNITESAQQELEKKGGYLLIDPDRARTYHPSFEERMKEDDKTAASDTHEVASEWAKRLFRKGMGEHRNLIIDQTAKDAGKVAGQVKQLREAGYRIDFRVVATHEAISTQGIYSRYEEQKAKSAYNAGRFTPKETHDQAFSGLPITVEMVEREKLADRISVYDMYGKLLYENELKNGEWQIKPAARETLEAERGRVLTPDERQAFRQNYERILNLMEARQASPVEMNEVRTAWQVAEYQWDEKRGLRQFGIGERAPWGDFPKVVRNGDLGSLSNEPEYKAAKGGDKEAALKLVKRLLSDETVHQVKALIGENKPKIIPVLAVENSGNNKIPLAMAEVLAGRLGLEIDLGIVQREKVGRTDSGADHRLAFTPTFKGVVQPGEKYLILDDTLTMGGTIASLRGYIENRGGKVLGASVMTAHKDTLELAVKPALLQSIEQKHGKPMNDYWKEYFGYGIEHLTQGEAGHLKSGASVDTLRTRIVAARHAGIERLDAGGTQAAGRSLQEGNREADFLKAEKGRIYEGAIVDADQGRVLQQTAEGVVAHERCELSGKNLDFESLKKSGQAVSIEYGKYAKIGIVREGHGRQKQGIGKAEPALKGRGLEKS